MISLIALAGPHGEIGHSSGERPLFGGGVENAMHWFLDMVAHGVVVCGRVTVDQMVRDGVDLRALPYTLAVFSRKAGPPTVIDFIAMVEGAHPGKDIFIAGGAQTYEAFLPFCQNIYIRKAEIKGSPDLKLPRLFAPKRTYQ